MLFHVHQFIIKSGLSQLFILHDFFCFLLQEMTIYLRDLPNDDEVGWWGRVWKKLEQGAEKNNCDKREFGIFHECPLDV